MQRPTTSHQLTPDGNGNGNGNGNGKGSGQRVPAKRSEAQQRAARQNGARSRGPRTPEGKRISSQNAVKHGLLAKILRPPADVREHHVLFDRVREALIEQVKPESFVEYWRIDLTASKAVQLATIRQMYTQTMAPPPPPSQIPAVPWNDVPIVTERLELLESRLQDWEAGAPFDCTPAQARDLAERISDVLKGAGENVAEAEVDGREVTPAERREREALALQAQKQREADEMDWRQHDEEEIERAERTFCLSVDEQRGKHQKEMRGLTQEQKRQTCEAFEVSLKEQNAAHERSLATLRAAHQERFRERARADRRALFSNDVREQSQAAWVQKLDEEELDECRQLVAYGDRFRLRDQTYVAKLLAGELPKESEVEGDRLRLVNLMREVLDDARDFVGRVDAAKDKLRVPAAAHLAARTQDPAVAAAERLERYEAINARALDKLLRQLGIG